MTRSGDLQDRLNAAMWAGDTDTLDRLAPCRCCCADHTFANCPARAWNGCRGQPTSANDDPDSWAAFYKRTRGMNEDEFFNLADVQEGDKEI